MADANDAPFWTATQAMTWLAFGKPETWGELTRWFVKFKDRWRFDPPADDMLHLLEAVGAKAPSYPWLPIMSQDGRGVRGYETDFTSPSRRIEGPSGSFKIGAPELARSVRRGHRVMLGRMVSYAELAAMLRADLAEYRHRSAMWNAANRLLRDAIARGRITALGVPASNRNQLPQPLPRLVAAWPIQFRDDGIEPDDEATMEQFTSIQASARFVQVCVDAAEVRAIWPAGAAGRNAPTMHGPQPFPDGERVRPWVAVSWRAFGVQYSPRRIQSHRSFDGGTSPLPDEEQAHYADQQEEHRLFDAAERELLDLLASNRVKAVGRLPAQTASGKRLHVAAPGHVDIPASTFLNRQLAFDSGDALIPRLSMLERLFPPIELRGSDADPDFPLYHDVLIEAAVLRDLWAIVAAPNGAIEILFWITNAAEMFLREKKSKPKREDLVRRCVAELHCRYEDAEAAYKQLPDHLRRKRGERG